MNLTLIGMPGAGKSHVGRLLAERLGYDFIDIDREIEGQFEGATLQEILDEIGVEEFKELEAKAVRELTENESRLIISPGGSIVYGPEIMEYLADISEIVYLDAPISLIEERIGRESRGIIGFPEKSLKEIYEERAPLYEKYADATLNASDSDEELVDQLALIVEKGAY